MSKIHLMNDGKYVYAAPPKDLQRIVEKYRLDQDAIGKLTDVLCKRPDSAESDLVDIEERIMHSKNLSSLVMKIVVALDRGKPLPGVRVAKIPSLKSFGGAMLTDVRAPVSSASSDEAHGFEPVAEELAAQEESDDDDDSESELDEDGGALVCKGKVKSFTPGSRGFGFIMADDEDDYVYFSSLEVPEDFRFAPPEVFTWAGLQVTFKLQHTEEGEQRAKDVSIVPVDGELLLGKIWKSSSADHGIIFSSAVEGAVRFSYTSANRKLRPGVNVIFILKTAADGPRATNVTAWGAEPTNDELEGGHTNDGLDEEEEIEEIEPFLGRVKSYFPERGSGHIACEKTFEEYRKDIPFAASATPSGCRQGLWVEFQLLSGSKGVSAVNIKPVPAPALQEPSSQKPTSGPITQPSKDSQRVDFSGLPGEVRPATRLGIVSHGKSSCNTVGEVRPAAHLGAQKPSPRPLPPRVAPPTHLLARPSPRPRLQPSGMTSSMNSSRPNAASGRHQLPPPPPPPPPPAWSTQHSKRHHSDVG